jgi:hypothetical protein
VGNGPDLTAWRRENICILPLFGIERLQSIPQPVNIQTELSQTLHCEIKKKNIIQACVLSSGVAYWPFKAQW